MNFAKKRKAKVLTRSFDYTYSVENAEVTENITIHFLDNFGTPAFFDAFTQLEKTNHIGAIAKQLAKYITDWSLFWQEEGEEQKPFPPTFENLSENCDTMFLVAIASEMMAVVNGDEKKPQESPKALAV